jgi:hypothetical protein
MVHQNSTLSQFSWQIIREYIDLNFEMFGASIFNVVIELSIFVQELK